MYQEKYYKYKNKYNELRNKMQSIIQQRGGSIEQSMKHLIHKNLFEYNPDIEKQLNTLFKNMPNKKKSNSINILNNYNIDEFLQNKSNTKIVVFHSPNCPYCVNFMPTFEDFSKKINENNIDCITGSMDVNKHILNKYTDYSQYIDGVPTILKFNNNSIEQFTAEKTIKNLLQFTENNNKYIFPENVITLSNHNFDEFINNNKYIGILFHRPGCPFCQEFVPIFNKFINTLDTKYIFAEFNADIHDLSILNEIYLQYIEGVPMFLKISKNKIVPFKQNRTVANLKKFIIHKN